MIKRNKQIITSLYGKRGNKFHRGIDLRCYNFLNWKKQPVIFPEKSKVIHIGYEPDWGWNIKFETLNEEKKNYILQYIHLEKPDLDLHKPYDKGDFIGWTTVTDYMIRMEFYEHLHMGVIDDDYIDPEIYLKDRNFRYGYKKGLRRK